MVFVVDPQAQCVELIRQKLESEPVCHYNLRCEWIGWIHKPVETYKNRNKRAISFQCDGMFLVNKQTSVHVLLTLVVCLSRARQKRRKHSTVRTCFVIEAFTEVLYELVKFVVRHVNCEESELARVFLPMTWQNTNTKFLRLSAFALIPLLETLRAITIAIRSHHLSQRNKFTSCTYLRCWTAFAFCIRIRTQLVNTCTFPSLFPYISRHPLAKTEKNRDLDIYTTVDFATATTWITADNVTKLHDRFTFLCDKRYTPLAVEVLFWFGDLPGGLLGTRVFPPCRRPFRMCNAHPDRRSWFAAKMTVRLHQYPSDKESEWFTSFGCLQLCTR